MSDKVKIRVNKKNQIEIGCPKYGDTIFTGVGDLAVDGANFVEAGKALCRWCKKDHTFPEVQIRIFEQEAAAPVVPSAT